MQNIYISDSMIQALVFRKSICRVCSSASIVYQKDERVIAAEQAWDYQLCETQCCFTQVISPCAIEKGVGWNSCSLYIVKLIYSKSGVGKALKFHYGINSYHSLIQQGL